MGASWFWQSTEDAEGADILLCRKEELVKVGGPLPLSCAWFCNFSSRHPVVGQLGFVSMDDCRSAWVKAGQFCR